MADQPRTDPRQGIDEAWRQAGAALERAQKAAARLRDVLETCSSCNGQGSTFYGKRYQTCSRCGGSGYEPKPEA